MYNVEEFKVVVFGDGGVGKTCLTKSFVQGIFVEKYDPGIEGKKKKFKKLKISNYYIASNHFKDSFRKLVEIGNKNCMVEIIDTEGTEQFTAMRDLFCKNGQGFILVYSIISNNTFECLSEIRDQIMRVKDIDDFPCILVGNKCDLEDERTVTKTEPQELAKKWGCPFIETSAKTRTNVNEMFENLIKQVLLNFEKNPKKKQKEKEGCCLF